MDGGQGLVELRFRRKDTGAVPSVVPHRIDHLTITNIHQRIMESTDRVVTTVDCEICIVANSSRPWA
ncbi:MAG: hypothetical protein CME24_00265 [Gemmatimonadetes bacterium]|nr:hypothetical protein [Gemmatimonadota bacterium]